MFYDVQEMSFTTLKNKLNVSESDFHLFVLYYYFLLPLYDNDQAKFEKRIEETNTSIVSIAYSYFVDFIYFLFPIKYELVNFNCNGRFGFVKYKKTSKLTRWLLIFSLKNLYLNRYMSGLAYRLKVFEVLKSDERVDVFELWGRVSQRNFLSKIEVFFKKTTRILEKSEVSCMYIVDYRDGISLSCAYIARKLGVNVCVIPHGYIQNYKALYPFASMANEFICWSPLEAKLVKSCFPNLKTSYYGCPIYNQEDVSNFRIKRNDKKRNMPSLSKRKVIFFSYPLSLVADLDQVFSFFLFLNKILADNNADLLIKQHPNDKSYGEELNKLGLNVIDGAVKDILLIADISVGFTSTTLFESAVLGVKSVLLNNTGIVDFFVDFDFVENIDFSLDGGINKLLEIVNSDYCFADNHGFDKSKLIIHSVL